MDNRQTRRFALIVLLGLVAWTVALRWPGFARQAWNLDEGIHATIAREILHGGVMYRDAIDQRTPLTYYLAAGVFAVAGENNMWALHFFAALVIALTAWGLFLIARRARGWPAGLVAAITYAACSSNLLYIGDARALHTELFVALFSTWAAVVFRPGLPLGRGGRLMVVGVLAAAAFLSKQTALLDFGAPLGTVALLGLFGTLPARQIWRSLGWLVLAFLVPVALTALYFLVHGALHDAVYYTWIYNLKYYGHETTLADRFDALAMPVRILASGQPVLLVAAIAGLASVATHLVQLHPSSEEKQTAPYRLYLLLWTALALAGVASSGRTYDHYLIQFFPPLALVVAEGFGLTNKVRFRWGRGLRIAALLAGAWALGVVPWLPPTPRTLGPDTSLGAARLIRKLTEPTAHIFAWGYAPDFYLFADRFPSSRFIYCSFLTGMIPWTNTAPGEDTSYAIVPGSMEQLISDLNRHPPSALLDASAAPYRPFAKYPIAKFPALAAWVKTNMLPVDDQQLGDLGFQVYLQRDSVRKAQLPLAGGKSTAPQVSIAGLDRSAPHLQWYTVTAAAQGARIQRLQLSIDNGEFDRVSFAPVDEIHVRFPAYFQKLGPGHHTLRARAVTSDGQAFDSAPMTVTCVKPEEAAKELAGFKLPQTSQSITPIEVTAPYGADASIEAGRQVMFAHAPSSIIYSYSGEGATLTGHFGFRDGAWAASNHGRTDGAVFLVVLHRKDGSKIELFHQWLQPVTIPADRGEHPLNVKVPAAQDARLELRITNGPAGNPASDWTYWSGMLLENSH